MMQFLSGFGAIKADIPRHSDLTVPANLRRASAHRILLITFLPFFHPSSPMMILLLFLQKQNLVACGGANGGGGAKDGEGAGKRGACGAVVGS